MKIYLTIISVSFFLFFQGCNTGVAPQENNYEMTTSDDSNIPDSVKSLYLQDAARLSLRYLYIQKSPDTLLIEIPNNLVSLLYSGLIHIYNCKTLDNTKYITKTNPIHTFPRPVLNTLLVAVDTSYSWTKAWQNKTVTTDNSQINDLILPYDFKIHSYFSLTTYYVAELKTDRSINLYALSERLEKIPGVLHAGPDSYGGGGNDIEATIYTNSNIEYIFSIGWGDCPSGCIERHYWKYTVDTEGYVHFVKEYGNQL